MTNVNQPDFGDLKVVRAGSANLTTSSSSRASDPTVADVGRVATPPSVAVVAGEPVTPLKPWITRFWWLPVLAVLGIGLALWGRGYYNARYVGTDFYAQIPAAAVLTPVEERDMAGNIVEVDGQPRMIINYIVTAFNDAGERRELEFTARADNPNRPQPGDYLRLNASNQLVLNQAVVPQTAVPAHVLDLVHGGQ